MAGTDVVRLAQHEPARKAQRCRPRRQKLSGRMKLAIAGIVLGLILFIVSPWLAIAVIVLAIGIPVGMYLALDPSQRRRINRIRRRQIGE